MYCLLSKLSIESHWCGEKLWTNHQVLCPIIFINRNMIKVDKQIRFWTCKKYTMRSLINSVDESFSGLKQVFVNDYLMSEGLDHKSLRRNAANPFNNVKASIPYNDPFSRIISLLNLWKQIVKRRFLNIFLQRNHSSEKPVEIQCTLVNWLGFVF